MRKLTIYFIVIILLSVSCNHKRQEQIVVKPNPSWYKPPLFAVMTGFIYYPKSTYSIWEWDKNLGKEFNAQKFVKELKEANIDYLIFYDKWIDGFVFHNTKTTKFKTTRDFFKEVSKACNDNGVKLVVYYNAVSDGNPEFEKGFARDYYGNVFPFSPNWPTNRSTLHYPDFREKSLEQLREIVSSYGKIDGIWFDIFNEVGDARNKCILQDAETRFHKPFAEITKAEFSLFQQETMGNYVKDARKITNQYQKDLVFTENGSIEGMNNQVRLNTVDYLMDYWMTETNSFASTDFQSWRAHFTPKPVEMGSLISLDWFAVKDSLAPKLRSKSMEEVIAETALAVCRGASIYLAITPGYAGDMGEGIPAVKAAGTWYGKVKSYLQDSRMVGNIGIVLGTPSVGGRGLPLKNGLWSGFAQAPTGALYEAVSLCEDISGAGYFPKVLYSYSDYTSWPSSLTGFKAIIIPEQAVLDKAHIQSLREYVKNGGKLISFAHSTLLNENGERLEEEALRDLFGIQNKGGNEEKGGSLLFGDSISKKYFDNQAFEVKYVLNPLFDKSVKLIAGLKERNGQPVIFENGQGRGKSIYIAAGEADFAGMASFWKGILAMNGVLPGFHIDTPDIAGSAISPSIVKGMFNKNLSRYYVVLKESSKGKVVHIIDRIAGNSKVNVTFDASLIGNISSALKIESGTQVPFEIKDGRISFSVVCDPVASIMFK